MKKYLLLILLLRAVTLQAESLTITYKKGGEVFKDQEIDLLYQGYSSLSVRVDKKAFTLYARDIHPKHHKALFPKYAAEQKKKRLAEIEKRKQHKLVMTDLTIKTGLRKKSTNVMDTLLHVEITSEFRKRIESISGAVIVSDGKTSKRISFKTSDLKVNKMLVTAGCVYYIGEEERVHKEARDKYEKMAYDWRKLKKTWTYTVVYTDGTKTIVSGLKE